MHAKASASLIPSLIGFATACENARSLAELEQIWGEKISRFGFTFAALGAHVDPLRPERASYVLHNYPLDWIAHFSAQRYQEIDPVYRAVEVGASEFIWTDPEFRQGLAWRQRRILAEARAFGLSFGRTHALAPVGRLKASASLVSDDPDIPQDVYEAAKIANILVHHRAVQLCEGAAPVVEILRRRERQCLELCASGITDSEIARMLEIGVATVRRHIERARLRLGASTRTQAAARAILSGQIKPIK